MRAPGRHVQTRAGDAGCELFGHDARHQHVIARGDDPDGFIGEVLADVWAREQDMSRPELVLAAAQRAGLDPAGLAEAAQGDGIEQAYKTAIADAVEAGVFGAPSYVLDGEIFWGQDRLDLLADALASGRPAYRNDATA